ncbi:LOB domain-containing protein 2 [Bienertia sinuspersici]
MVRNLLNDEDRKRAADSLVWEALCRQKDPILGPYGEFRKIYDELKSYQTHQAQTQVVQTQVHHQTGQFVSQNGHTNGSVYKTGNGLIGWSVSTNGSGSINNKMSYNGGINDNVALVDCIRAQCGPVIGSGLYGNCGSQDDLHGAEGMRQDIDVSVGSVVPTQQHLMNGFNQHYYLPGELQ